MRWPGLDHPRVVLEKIATRALRAKGLVRAFRVVTALSPPRRRRQRCCRPLLVVELVERLLVRAVCALHVAVELGRVGRRDEQPDARSEQACSNSPWNSEPPCTWTALSWNGSRASSVSRKRVALAAVACVPSVPLTERVPIYPQWKLEFQRLQRCIQSIGHVGLDVRCPCLARAAGTGCAMGASWQ